jgi:hypothetical protein
MRVLGDIGHPDRARILDERAEHSPAGGQIANRRVLGRADPVGDEYFPMWTVDRDRR